MDFSDVVEQHFPYDGPHSRDQVVAAAQGVPALIRYLNNATGPWNSRTTLTWGSTVYRVVAGVGGTLAALDQLLGQLTDASERMAEDPTLYDDRRDRPARSTALEVATCLYEARPVLAALVGAIDRAGAIAVHLGIV